MSFSISIFVSPCIVIAVVGFLVCILSIACWVFVIKFFVSLSQSRVEQNRTEQSRAEQRERREKSFKINKCLVPEASASL